MTRTFLVCLLTLGDPARLTGGYLYHRRMAEAAPRHGARIEFLSIPDRPFPLGIFDAPGALRQARRLRPDVLVLDSIAAPFLAPWSRAVSARLPLAAMLHQPPGGIDHGRLRTAVQARLDRAAYEPFRLLLVASESLREELHRQGVAPERMRVVPPGRDADATAGGPPVALRTGSEAVLLSVGNWIPRKGLDALLEAVARLPARTAVLHLVGDDRADPRYAERVRARMARSDLAGRVVVHGPVERDRVAAYYAAADVFVLPSLREPYGTVYGEAMAAGLPVVGWRAGNLPWLADDWREGVLVPPGDVEGLRAALRRLVDDELLRREMGRAARARAMTRPTWEESAALFFGALRETAAAPPSALVASERRWRLPHLR